MRKVLAERRDVTDPLPKEGTYARAVFDLLESRAGQEVTINCQGRMGRRTGPAIRLLQSRYGCDIWNNSLGTFVLAGRRVLDGDCEKYIDYVLTIPARCV